MSVLIFYLVVVVVVVRGSTESIQKMEGRSNEEELLATQETTATTNTTIDPPGEVKDPPPPPVVFQNPYATKKTRANIQNNNYDHKNKICNDGVASGKGDQSSKTATATAAFPSVAKSPPPGSDPFRTPKNRNLTWQEPQKQQQQLAHWERLPSRNLSFTSAEVLTITECLKEGQSIAKLYCGQGRSVRITGILDQRTIRCKPNDETSFVVEMQVKDPMETTTKTAAEKVRARAASFKPSTTVVTPAAAPKAFQKRRRSPAFTTPSKLLSKSKHSGMVSMEERNRLLRKKRPWFVGSSSSSLTSGSKISKGNNIRSSSSAPVTAFSALRVIVDPKSVVGATRSLEAAVVGSFVTVIGEFSVVADDLLVSQKSCGGTRKPLVRYDLEARTLMVINNNRKEGPHNSRATTDMVFYEKALALRRKTVYARYHHVALRDRSSETTNTTGNTSGRKPENVMLLQGCGPPPYDAIHRQLEEEDSGRAERQEEPQANRL